MKRARRREAEADGSKNNAKPKFQIDPEALDCTICLEPLSSPIFQCKNGHVACTACRMRFDPRCPSCRRPLGNIRNLLAEKIIELLQVTCAFAVHGCTTMLMPPAKEEHERSCQFAPFQCPIPRCEHSGPLRGFANHFSRYHKIRVVTLDVNIKATFTMHPLDVYVIFRVLEHGSRHVFVLHHKREQLGDIFFITGLLSHKKRYRLEVNMLNDNDRHMMETATGDFRQAEESLGTYLLIPKRPRDSFVNKRFQLHVCFMSALEEYVSESVVHKFIMVNSIVFDPRTISPQIVCEQFSLAFFGTRSFACETPKDLENLYGRLFIQSAYCVDCR